MRERFDGTILFRTECSKASHTPYYSIVGLCFFVCLFVLGFFLFFVFILSTAGGSFCVMAEQDSDLLL